MYSDNELYGMEEVNNLDEGGNMISNRQVFKKKNGIKDLERIICIGGSPNYGHVNSWT